ncbi:NAD(P)-binding protein [Hyaloscypha variabilis F]|uniref:NAD(P)-binding protein n=1 Tax=Hyaloscypha variabilis (strain UAMH 11265 / GT02V1 / F) TaxID=1149755 RepID=A0A2J6RX16_HYAVF|nr:NAD(P)-binding protein [Hyaloscypha variabilis F]
MPVFVITGANRGLGLEFVRQLSTDSSNTILAATRSLSRDLSDLESLKSKGATIHILECDTGSQDSITAFSKQVASVLGGDDKKIDFLLNNAGINATPKQTSLTLTPDSLANHINVNVLGPANTVQVLESHLQKGTVVMNMTSGLGSLGYSRTKDPTGCTSYSISKAALNMLTVHQADNLKGKGVVVVCIDPGWVKTDMGGSGAVLEKEESIGGMLKCLRGLKSTDSGRFFLYDGSERPW